MIKFDFHGTNVVITGASGGIGIFTAMRFLEAGASVFLHTVRNQLTIKNLLEKYGTDRPCSFCKADWTIPEERQMFYEEATAFFPKIDVWVNAAGLDLMASGNKPLLFDDKLKKLLETDVIAPVEFAKKIAPLMQKQENGGTVFFFGWDGVDYGMSGETAELYGIAKGALQGFCKCFAASVAPEVKVRLLSLGWIETRWGKQASEMYQQLAKNSSLQNRWGTPDDVAKAVLFLSSKEAEYVDCNPVYINGGKR